MSTFSNDRSADRTAHALVAVVVVAMAGLATAASVGHSSVRAEALAGPLSSLVSPLLPDGWPTAVLSDPSLPSAAVVLEHAAGGTGEDTATF